MKGELPAAEVTFRTAAAVDTIKTLKKEFPDMLVGARAEILHAHPQVMLQDVILIQADDPRHLLREAFPFFRGQPGSLVQGGGVFSGRSCL